VKILGIKTSPFGDDAASWRIYNIARLLQSNGHDIQLVQYTRKSTYEKLKGKEVKISDISNSIVTVPCLALFTVHIRHLRELARENYDLVYGNTHSGTFCSVFGRLKGIPLIFDMHGGIVEEFLLNNQSNPAWKHSPRALYEYFIDRIIESVDLHFSDKIICVSKKMIQHLHSKKGVPLEKMAYVTNGVDLDFLKPVDTNLVQAQRSKNGLEKKFVFGYIGDFSKWQGVENFIDAAKMIDDPEITFVIVGGDKQSKEGNRIFIPKVPRSQTRDYYSICDVLVLPRPSHPATEIAAPTKFAEYTAAGKPILTTKVGDAADLVRGYNCGIVAESNSQRDLVNAILEFRSKSKVELTMMGENSRRLAENEFDWNKIAANLLEAIKVSEG
jgi:glycosyltransferase involved in cell wall biosynthesis